jgi:two-component sensor histidine kinase
LKLAFDSGSNDDGSEWARLTIEDSGPGLPPGIDLSKPQSMGYQLVNLLVRQLRAKFDVGKGPGTRITVSFPI